MFEDHGIKSQLITLEEKGTPCLMTGPPGAHAIPSRPPSVADKAKGTKVWKMWSQKEYRTVLMLNTNNGLVHERDLSSFDVRNVFSLEGEEKELENIFILLGHLIDRFR